MPISWPDVVVTDAKGNTVEAQVLPFNHQNVRPASAARDNVGEGGGGGSDRDQRRSFQQPYTLMLPVESAEPLEATVFNVSRNIKEEGEGGTESLGTSAEDAEQGQGEPRRRRHFVGGDKGANAFSISSDLVTLTFDGATGRLARMETHAEGGGSDGEGGAGAKPSSAALDVDQGWFYYPTFAGGEAAKKAAKESKNDAAAETSGSPTEEEEGNQPHQQPSVLPRMEGAMEASRLHGQLRERLHSSQDQKGGAYIFRPEGEGRGGAKPVRAAAGGGRTGGEEEQDELVIREWWVEEGPVVSEVYQVRWLNFFAFFGRT